MGQARKQDQTNQDGPEADLRIVEKMGLNLKTRTLNRKEE
jgi:hypothetical protein